MAAGRLLARPLFAVTVAIWDSARSQDRGKTQIGDCLGLNEMFHREGPSHFGSQTSFKNPERPENLKSPNELLDSLDSPDFLDF